MLAVLFPGQGSQATGMVPAAWLDLPQIKTIFEIAEHSLGYDLWQLIQENPDNKLNQTEYTQPALLASSLAYWQMVQLKTSHMAPLLPQYLAGHSLGEYSALVAAGTLELGPALKLVAERGRLMQAAVEHTETAMAAIIGLEQAKVAELCQQAGVEMANINAKYQIVIAGVKAQVEQALVLAKAAGSKLAKVLPVSVPSHCSLMQTAADKLADQIAALTIHYPSASDLMHKQPGVIHNVDGQVYNQKPEDEPKLRQALIQQLYKPVQWLQINCALLQNKQISSWFESGPGKVLTNMLKRTAQDYGLTPPEFLEINNL